MHPHESRVCECLFKKQWASNRCRFVSLFFCVYSGDAGESKLCLWVNKKLTEDSGCVGSLGHNNNNKNFTLPNRTNRYTDTLLYTV